MMQATQAQAFYGQGTHSLASDVAELRKVRTAGMKWLWKTELYSMSPLVTFEALAPVQLDPEFGAVYEGLRTVMRAMRREDVAATIRDRHSRVPTKKRDGPSMRLCALTHSATFQPAAKQLLTGANMSRQEEDKWLHDMRDTWRAALWNRVAKERSQHYAGAENADRKRTMQLYDTWHKQTRSGDWSAEGAERKVLEEKAQDLSVLCRILAGGLLTNEGVARHKKNGESTQCSCGAEQATVEHISWECPR